MPYVSEKIKIQNTKYDRKIKITKEIREEIEKLYSEGKTQTYIAKLFGVDRKTIYNVLNEDKYQEQLKRRREEKAHLTYYDRERHTKYMREHRKYKQKLYVEGKIKKWLNKETN